MGRMLGLVHELFWASVGMILGAFGVGKCGAMKGFK